MKNLMLMMSLMILVSCNGKDAENIRRAIEGEDEYTQEEVDALNCNEEILGWAAKVPASLTAAEQSMEENPQFQGCGHFDIYIDEVIVENPRATYLRDLLEQEDGPTTEEDTKNELTPEQVEALNCNEDFLQLDSNPPADLAEARARMNQNRGYKKCGFFNLYIDELTYSNPDVVFLKELIKE